MARIGRCASCSDDASRSSTEFSSVLATSRRMSVSTSATISSSAIQAVGKNLLGLAGGAAEVALVAAGGLADDGGEGLDEAGRVGPAAQHGGAGHRMSVEQVNQGVLNTQQGSPLVEAHAELGVEQAAECPVAGAGR